MRFVPQHILQVLQLVSRLKPLSPRSLLKAFRKRPQISVLVTAVAIYTPLYFYYLQKTSEMVPSFEKFVGSIAYSGAKVMRETKGDGFSAGVTVYYRVPVGTSNKDIYEHYCELMDKNGWVDSQEAQIGGADKFGSSCVAPWRNEGSRSVGPDVFDFSFCKRNGDVLSVIWGRDRNLDHPVNYAYSVSMSWRFTGPADKGCLMWLDKWEAEKKD